MAMVFIEIKYGTINLISSITLHFPLVNLQPTDKNGHVI